jgi:hypothetical protein
VAKGLADGYLRERRLWDLVWRMASYKARAATISRWTGVSERRVRAFARRYSVSATTLANKPRGRSPHKLEAIFRAPVLKIEAAIFATVCVNLGCLASDGVVRADLYLPDIERGEQLCRAYKVFKRQFRDASLTMEQALLVYSKLLRTEEFWLTICGVCATPVLLTETEMAERRCNKCGARA